MPREPKMLASLSLWCPTVRWRRIRNEDVEVQHVYGPPEARIKANLCAELFDEGVGVRPSGGID